MKTQRIDEYHKHGSHIYGKLVSVNYLDDAQKDPRWGTFGAGLTYDYLARARALIAEKYGAFTEVLSIPELVVRIEAE